MVYGYYFYFENEENKDAFDVNPDLYLPQYGTSNGSMIATNGKSPTTPHGTHRRRFLFARNLDRGQRKLIIGKSGVAL